jgi:hypothetical protein
VGQCDPSGQHQAGIGPPRHVITTAPPASGLPRARNAAFASPRPSAPRTLGAAPLARQTGEGGQCLVTDTNSCLQGAGQVTPAQCHKPT